MLRPPIPLAGSGDTSPGPSPLPELPADFREAFDARERSKGTTLVGADDIGELVVTQGDEGRIATGGLCGCTATATLLKLEDGTQKARIQHYNPLMFNLCATLLSDYLTSAEKAGGLVGARTVIMVPGTPRYQQDEVNYRAAEGLKVDVQGLTEAPSLAELYPYDPYGAFQAYGNGTLAVEIGSDSQADIIAELTPVQF